MNSRELRIGNFLNYDTGEGVELAVIDWQDLKWISENDKSFNKAHSPIPLTEEWLLRFGFEKNYKFGLYYKGGHAIDIHREGNAEFYTGEVGGWFVFVEHIHQLQNLYFALTGEELTIKNDANN
jgi:hypothetical protein